MPIKKRRPRRDHSRADGDGSRPRPARLVQQTTAPAAPPRPAAAEASATETARVPVRPPAEPPRVDAARLSEAIGTAASRRQDATRGANIAIVDDEPGNVAVVRKHLQRAGYSRFTPTTDSAEAVPLIRERRPDLVLLDINMPRVSGLDILHVMAMDPELAKTPVLIMTGSGDAEMKRICLELGAVDFLTKPLQPLDLIPRVRNTLTTKLSLDRLARQAAHLEEEVRSRTEELARSREEIVHCLARAAEHRDDDTGHHVLRVGRYVGVIAQNMGFPQAQIEVLELAAQLHDIGKIGVPDAILFKPGKLDDQEYALIRQHCAVGKQIIKPLSADETRVLRSHSRLGAGLLHVPSSPLLMIAAKIAQTHHEWWDGSGYPLKLQGTDIPIEGRMTAVADVFDALSSKRPYKDAFPREKCFRILEEGRGTQFDPNVLDAFFAGAEEIIEVQLELMDEADA